MADSCQIDPQQELHFSDEECRQLVRRIAASREFQRATKQREFLLYVVDRKLAGCPEDVTEALIGHRVYGRPASYDSGNDSIVRTEARTLRKRLKRYFDTQGIDEPVWIDIPRGGYIPVFRPKVEQTANQIPPQFQQVQKLPSRRQWLWGGVSTAAVAAALLAWRKPSLLGARTVDLSPTPGLVQLDSSDPQLNLCFQRAKQRALSCVYTGDPVGDWYATRPDGGSNVFCMRDVAHQSRGAAVLGLSRHTSNMLRCFVKSVSRSRDWCGYWVITKDGLGAPSSYTSDSDFGYCLPANFDLLRTCYHEFLWSGDPAYLGPEFLNYYDITATNYPQTWDADHDGIMENVRRPRVHASYFQQQPDFLTGADLVAAQYAGYRTYAAMQESIGRDGSLSKRLATDYRAKAETLRSRFNAEWWNPASGRYYSGVLRDHHFAQDLVPECNLYSLLFGVTEDGAKTEAALDTAEKYRPQFPGAYSYLPEVMYRYNRNDRAYPILMEIAGDAFFGKDAGEVSFAVIGTIACGLMGLAPQALKSTVETRPRLAGSLKWARLSHVPVLRNEITIEHRGTEESTLTNTAGPTLWWKVSFLAPASTRNPQIIVDGMPTAATLERPPHSQPVVSAVVPVGSRQSRTAKCLA